MSTRRPHESLYMYIFKSCYDFQSRAQDTLGLEREVVWLRRGSWDGDKNNKPIHAAGDTHAAAAVKSYDRISAIIKNT